LNLVGENIAYYATFKRAGVSKTGTLESWIMPDLSARLFKTLFTGIQNVYGDAKKDLLRSLDKFDKTLQVAGLLLITRVDENVSKIQNAQEGSHFFAAQIR
jgi:glutathionyl-hydroquinone reductase